VERFTPLPYPIQKMIRVYSKRVGTYRLGGHSPHLLFQGIGRFKRASVQSMVSLLPPAQVVGVPVSVGPNGSEPEDLFGSFPAPAHAGRLAPVFYQVAAGPFNHAGGNGPAIFQVPLVLHLLGVALHPIFDTPLTGAESRKVRHIDHREQ